MDIEKATEKLDKADGFLDRLKTLLRKHWGLLLLILFSYFIYWALTTDLETEPYYYEELEPIQNKLEYEEEI